MPTLVRTQCQMWLDVLKAQLHDEEAAEATFRDQADKSKDKQKELTKAINYMTNWLN